MTNDLESEIKQLKKEIYHLTWYMRGGVSSHDLFNNIDIGDVEILNTVIKENFEATKKSKMPLI